MAIWLWNNFRPIGTQTTWTNQPGSHDPWLLTVAPSGRNSSRGPADRQNRGAETLALDKDHAVRCCGRLQTVACHDRHARQRPPVKMKHDVGRLERHKLLDPPPDRLRERPPHGA